MYEDRKYPDGRWRPAGVCGGRWQNYMRDYYPEEYQQVIDDNLFFPIAYKIDEEAEHKREIYTNEWLRTAEPRPDTFVKIAEWEREKQDYVNFLLNKEVILRVRTSL
ncbi:hypothetical protein FACS1894132_13140 [Clostridia bacterium]|nr:hypothetical protein FACS1894132_13140 [Clostridia bacterium]